MNLLTQLAEREAERLRRESERMRREIETTYSVLGLGRSTTPLQAVLERDLAGIRSAAETMVREYKSWASEIEGAQPGKELRRTLEDFATSQLRITEEQLQRDADLAGIGREHIDRQITTGREDLIRFIHREIGIAEERHRLAKEAGWPSFEASPSREDQAPLTKQIFGRNKLDADLPRTLAFAERESVPVAFLIGDLDRFKSINDDLGHPAGDRVLLTVADCLRKVVGTKGRCYRMGGEEFAALLPNSTAEEVRVLAERLRKTVEEAKIEGVARSITISIGLSTYPCARTCEELKQQADDALYRSKYQGRNRVTQFEEDMRRVDVAP